MRALKLPRWIIILLAVVVLAGIGYAVFTLTRPQEELEMAGETVMVERDAIESIVTVSGTTELGRQAKIIYGSGGVVQESLVGVGDQVEPGQVIVRLDTEEAGLELDLEQAESALRVAQLNFERLTSKASDDEIAAAKAAMDSAQARYDELLDGIPQEDIDNATASVTAAEASLRSAQANLDSLKSGATSEEIQAAEASVTAAEASVRSAEAALESLKSESTALNLTAAVSVAEANLRSAEASLASLKDSSTIQSLVAAASAAEASLRSAEASLDSLKDGSTRQSLVAAAGAAEANLRSAEAALTSLKDGSTRQSLAAAARCG